MEKRSPLKDRPLRVPGQSVEEERDRVITDGVQQWLFMALFLVVMAALEWYRYFVNLKPSPVLYTALAIGMCGFAAWRIRGALPKIRALRQARDGERAVGQFLEEMRADGYRVFHDLMDEEFNVDHLLIGPAGVFTIETKTWSKPAKGGAEIHFDGEIITAAGFTPERDPVVQAKSQARWVRKLLGESAGKALFVRPVVVFPGWFVVNASGTFKDVWVLEPKALPAFLRKEPIRLEESDIRLLAYHVSRFVRTQESR